MSTAERWIHMEHRTRVFYTDESETHAPSGVHLNIAPGEDVTMSGPSGCNKSTRGSGTAVGSYNPSSPATSTASTA